MEDGFEYLEHPADVYIAAYGASLKEAFENAAKALFDVITDVGTVTPREEVKIVIEGHDLHSLLYNWLEEFLYKFDSKALVFSKFNVKSIRKTPEGYVLEAEAWGEFFDVKRHPQRTYVKSPTYSLMEVTEKPDKAIVKFVLDI